MKITVLGAGAIGASIARDLQQAGDVQAIQVCDARARSLQTLQTAIGSDKLRSFQVDARDLTVMRSILAGSDCVVAGTAPEHYAPLAGLCVSLGVPYCDLGGTDHAVHQVLGLGEAAREAGVWLVPNCGLAPGLVNVLSLHAVERLDEVDAVQLRVGDVPADPQPPFNFSISWSADKVIDDYSNPSRVIEDGEIALRPALSGLETLAFEPPFEQMEAFATQGGLTTLADALRGRVRTLDHKTIRWPGHAHQMRFLMALGFAERKTIDVRTHLTYRDVLTRRMRQRLSAEQPDVLLMRVLVRGTSGGARQTVVYEMKQAYHEEDDTSAMKHATSAATSAVALMLARREVDGGGAAPPEHVVDKAAYLASVQARGLELTETVYDGWRDVRNPHVALGDATMEDAPQSQALQPEPD
jgi:saccharopine dehydrogenase-like NADP-dependent oxidoreductase